MDYDREATRRRADALREKHGKKAKQGGNPILKLVQGAGKVIGGFVLDGTVDTGSGPQRLGDRVGFPKPDPEAEALAAQYPAHPCNVIRFDGVYQSTVGHGEL